jgi:hypothetical protein
MEDRLARRGLENCALRSQANSRNNRTSFFLCRFTKRLWGMIKEWLGSISINDWAVDLSINSWWINMSSSIIPNRKVMAFLTMLASWTIWNEINARVFSQQICSYDYSRKERGKALGRRGG